jgi:hypothetical protein
MLNAEATLITPRKAWWYIERSTVDFDNARGSQGAQMYLAPNPDFGAVFTYYLKEEIQSLEKERKAGEKGEMGNIAFPGWDALAAETRETGPFVFLEVKDAAGIVVNRVMADNKKGFNRVAWNLRVGGTDALGLNSPSSGQQGFLCAPGTYTASMNKFEKGVFTQLAGPVEVTVAPMMKGTLDGSSMDEVVGFWRSYEELSRDLGALSIRLSNERKRIDQIFSAAMNANVNTEMLTEIGTLKEELNAMDMILNGNPAKNQIGERNKPLLGERLFALSRGISTSTYGPTETHKQTMEIIESQMSEMEDQLSTLAARVKQAGSQVKAAGGSWVEGID